MTLFISDLHLSPARPAIVKLFLEFLEQDASGEDALYILGDMFDAWIGDDDDDPEVERILAGLRDLVQKGTPVYIMHGNHDFLIGPVFEARSGCKLLPEPSVIDLYGEPVLLMHGDSLCTLDVGYQEVRVQVRSPKWQQTFLCRPLVERAALARQFLMQSRETTRLKADNIMDVTPSAVQQVMREHQVTRLIHGHTHRPGTHDFLMDGQAMQRIVLGDWYEQGSVLQCDAEDCQLKQLQITSDK